MTLVNLFEDDLFSNSDQYCCMSINSNILGELKTTKTKQPYAVALKSHYKLNRHHPEHFVNADEMEPLDVKEMTCDHLACVCGPRWRDGVECTIEQAAEFCKLKFPKWRGDYYKGEYDNNSSLKPHVRWPKENFPEEEKFVLIRWLVQLLNNVISLREFRIKIKRLNSIQFYCRDLWWHRKAIREIVAKLFPEDDDLQDRAMLHDNDKWDPVSITTYTLHWIFGVSDIETD